MRNLEIVELHKNDLPGYELVAYKEIGVPFFMFSMHFIYSQKKELPVVQEFVINLLELNLNNEDISKLLALEIEVVEDAIFALYQSDFISPFTNELTTKAIDYLNNNRIDSYEKADLLVVMDSITGFLDANVNNYISPKTAKQQGLFCIRNYLSKPTESTLIFKQAQKIFNIYKEKNELTLAGDLIEVIKLEKPSTKYKRINVLIYQNNIGEVRIQAFDRNKKIDKYEAEFKLMDDNDNLNLGMANADEFVNSKYVKNVYSDLESTFIEENRCSNKQYLDIFDASEPMVITIPLIEIYDPSEHFMNLIENKLKSKQDVTIVLSGYDYTNNYEENYVSTLISLKKTYSNLNVFQIKVYIPHIIISGDNAIINVLKKNTINLKSIKHGLTEELFNLSEQSIELIRSIAPFIFNQEGKKVNINSQFDKNALREKMQVIKELAKDCNNIIIDNLGVGILHDNTILNENDFINTPLAMDKNKFSVFLSTINKNFFEAIKENGKKTGNKDYFWTIFKNRYPELQRTLDKSRVYRNKMSHWNLDVNNETKYREYLEEDLDGYMPELIKDGYFYLQQIILTSLEKSLRDILGV